MNLRPLVREKFSVFSLAFLSLSLAATAFAGTNEGFTVALDPKRVNDIEVGAIIPLDFSIGNISQIKGALIEVKYDPALLAPVQGGFDSNVDGGILAGAIGGNFFGQLITPTEDGLTMVEAGLTLFSPPNQVSGGPLGQITFEVIGDISTEGTFLSVVKVQINGTSSEDTDTKIFALGEFGKIIKRRFPNILSEPNVERKHNGAIITWSSSLPGVDDKVKLWPLNNPEEVREIGNPLLDKFENSAKVLSILEALASEEIPLTAEKETILAALEKLGIEIPGSDDPQLTSFNNDLLALARTNLTPLDHLVIVKDLSADTEYAFEATSTSFAGDLSVPRRGTFSTRKAPNTTPVQITGLTHSLSPVNEQISVIVQWTTNRPADTRVQIAASGEDLPDPILSNTENGTLAHNARIDGLSPREDYTFAIGSRLVGSDALIDEGLMSEEQALSIREGKFRTPRLRKLDLLFIERPYVNPSTESAIIDIALNLSATAQLDFGICNNPCEELSTEEDADTIDQLYTETVTSDEPLERHSFTLSDLDPSTKYRYRITAFPLSHSDGLDPEDPAESEQAPPLTTDFTGNQPWSKDLKFITSSAADIFPPEIVEGPILTSLRDRLAVVSVTTDVPTTARIFFGTTDGTYGTADELEIIDINAQGKPRFELDHFLTLVGLEPGVSYSYRLELQAANGKTTIFEPADQAPAAKIARILQPPGGSGSFVTNSFPDTQFPIITFGPVNTSNTHDSAVVEWNTDESADSEGHFGSTSEDLEDFASSGDNVISHKLVFSNLESGTSYNYVIGSTDPSGNGATESALAAFTTNPEIDLTRPEIEEGPEITYKNDRSATIYWKLNELASGGLEFGTSEELGFIRTLPGSDTEQEITLTNLSPNTTYYYQVASTDLSNNGPTESAILQFTTDEEADITAPVISDITFAPADSSVIINWLTDELADSFVEFGTDPALLEFNVGDANDVLEHEITLTNLIPGTNYFLQVGSVDRSGNQADFVVADGFATLTLADLTPPITPLNLTGTPGSEQVILSWDANTELDLGGYNIYRRLAVPEFEARLLASGVINTTYTDLGLTNGSTYEYQITAMDRAAPPNESAATDILSLVPVAAASPSTPTALEHGGENILLPTFIFTNAEPANIGATLTYTIQISTAPDFSNVTAATSGLEEGAGEIGIGQTAWTIDRELEEGATYYWRVRAVEGDLLSPFSATQQFVAQDAVLLPGDFNEDGSVNFADFFMFVDVFNQPVTDENRIYDLAEDGNSIDFGDFFVFVDNFNRTLSGKRRVTPMKIEEDTIIALESLGGTRADDQLVTVRVWAGQVEKLKAFGLVLNYDPQTVQFLNASPGQGNLLESRGGKAPLSSPLSLTPGQIALGNGIVEGKAVSGQGLLAELSFRLIGSANDAYFRLREAYIAHSGDDVRQVRQVRSTQLRPQTYLLGANFPNPFNPSTSIEYALPQSGPVELHIYDVLGRRVTTLVKEAQHPVGFYTLTWDGRDQAGRSVGSGIYFYRLETSNFTQTRKMLLIK